MSNESLNTNEGERNMKLTKFEVSNILDALEEWFVNVVPKELSEKDIGLDDYRYSMIHRKLTTFLEQKEEKKI
jgi:hypothetical protein